MDGDFTTFLRHFTWELYYWFIENFYKFEVSLFVILFLTF